MNGHVTAHMYFFDGKIIVDFSTSSLEMAESVRHSLVERFPGKEILRDKNAVMFEIDEEQQETIIEAIKGAGFTLV